MDRFVRQIFTALMLLLTLATGAIAHPHIFIDARVVVVFSDQGEMVGLRQAWTFDPLYSAWAIQGLDEDGDGVPSSDELQPLADDNMLGLKEFNYYTVAGLKGGANIPFLAGRDARMEYDGTNLQLAFVVDFETPVAPTSDIEIEVADPEYYSGFQFAEGDAVFFDNAPEICTAEVNGPRPIDPAIEQQLYALGTDVFELPEELAQAVKDLSNVIIVRCGEQERVEAAPVVKQKPKGSPFVAPPRELNLGGQQSGFFGWINSQQKAFYRALTDAMAQMRTDGSAFWVLGGLSFLYGVFHAAGPGHGKIVISSYMVANESELRQGILLSFATALMQSVVAVVFVLVAASVLRLTSFAMSDAAHWMAVTSYALVMMLGLWLIWRKLSKQNHHAHHDHEHDEGCDGHHTPEPGQFRGRSWREQLGLIMSVGLRPCSGALVVLAFALSQQLLLAGIAATFLMGLGTAITVSGLAAIAVYFKNFAKTRAAAKGGFWHEVLGTAELVGAFLVFGFGALLLFSSF
ncbi:DUF1007 family protein [Maritalea sp.]|jgi:ABC-type nickel/cobalt efflux system permease component RcnA/ABC-type uncharacterized transport system substrate-binding protein|uniref:HoxN/HupN/NixA family nickel/cobalt transporter n=1 Tax=Maritalea sp. TaxID=2003361 RepID=UPI0039E4CF87